MPFDETERTSDVTPIQQALLAHYTTFQIGGPCTTLYPCQTPAELIQTVSDVLEKNTPYILMGGGSNMVVSDEGLSCAVIRYHSSTPQIHRKGHRITTSGSTLLDHLVAYAVDQGLEGLTYASGIPGTLGGAIVGNAGAFGKQIGDVLIEATLLTHDGCLKTVSKEDFQFAYRTSRLKTSSDIVVSATFFLQDGSKVKLQEQRKEYLSLRRLKHPDLETYPCAGSFFRNIEPSSAAEKRQATGYFLDKAGGKQLFHGGAAIFEKHANIIINADHAKAEDVYKLHIKMLKLANTSFDLKLEREVRFVGQFKNKPADAGIIW